VLVGLTAFRQLALYRSIRIVGTYLKGREEGFFKSQGVDIRWERTRYKKDARLVIWSVCYWACLLAFTAAVGVYGFWCR
jgi:hypothetical protein